MVFQKQYARVYIYRKPNERFRSGKYYSILPERYNITTALKLSMFFCLFQARKQTSDRNAILCCEPFREQFELDNLKTKIRNILRFP